MDELSDDEDDLQITRFKGGRKYTVNYHKSQTFVDREKIIKEEILKSELIKFNNIKLEDDYSIPEELESEGALTLTQNQIQQMNSNSHVNFLNAKKYIEWNKGPN